MNKLMMEQKPTGETFVQQLLNYSIAEQFLDAARYKQTLELNKKGSYFFQSFCNKLQNYYRLILQVPSNCQLHLQNNSHLEKWQLKKFKQFLVDLFEIFNLISQYQIGSFSTLKNSQVEFEAFDFTFHKFIANLSRYSSQQHKFQPLQQKYKFLFEELQVHEKYLKKKMKKTHYNFNIDFINTELTSFQEKLTQKEDLENQLTELAQLISSNTREFQKDLMFLKQKIIKNKYEQIQKITRMCKNARQSLMEIVTYLFDFLQKNQQMFARKKNDFLDGNLFSEADPKKLEALIVSETNFYSVTLHEYIELLNELVNSFSMMGEVGREWKGKQGEFIEEMKKYYQFKECDCQEIQLVLNSYNIFLKNFSQLGQKLVFSVNNINQLEKKARKCSQMTMTLTKCRKRKYSQSEIKQKEDIKEEKKYLQILNQQISPSYIQHVINKVYNDFREAVTKIRDTFLAIQPNKRKKVEDSMSISYISEVSNPSASDRRPSKAEFWLWHNWKIETHKEFHFSEELDRLLKQLVTLSNEFKLGDRELESLSCEFQTKRLKGVLRLREKSLLFESNDRALSLFLPFTEVENVDIELKMTSKTLSVETAAGTLRFTDLTEGGVKKFYFSVQKALDSFRQGNQEKPADFKRAVLGEQELEFIRRRRTQIENSLQIPSNYTHFLRVFVRDVSLVDFFKVVYSGQPVILNGKQYLNFTDSVTKKLQNFNNKYGVFDSPGPCYYSGQQQVTFFNCPLYSTKITECDHYLPKVPFMPEACHNVLTQNFYWISHEQFHIKGINKTNNAPFVENYNMHNFNTYKQVNQDVEINFYYKIHEVKDFSFKSTIYQKSIIEVAKGTEVVVDQIHKVMARYRKRGQNDNAAPAEEVRELSINSDRTVVKDYKKTITHLKSEVKNLKYILAAVFLINIVIIYWF